MTLHHQEVILALDTIYLHCETLQTLAGLLERCEAGQIDSDLVRGTGSLITAEVNHMRAWLSRLDKVTLGSESRTQDTLTDEDK